MAKSWDNWKGAGIRWHEPGKPDIYLLGDRSEYWKQDDPTDPSKIVIAQHQLMDEVYAIVQDQTLQPNSIALFRSGIQHEDETLRSNHVIWTRVFSHYFEELKPLLLELVSHHKAKVRLSIIQGLDPLPPEPETTNILSAGLIDKSKKVRSFTVQQIRQNDQKQVLPNLSNLLEKEQDPDLSNQLKTVISILTKGYFVEPDPYDPLMCTVHHGTKYERFDMSIAEAASENIQERLNALTK